VKINKLDYVVTPFWSFSNILWAEYEKGVPFGICFGGLKLLNHLSKQLW